MEVLASELSSSGPWTIRPFQESDFSFIIFCVLASNRYAPDGIAMGANRDKEAQRRYWIGAERLVQRLVERCEVRVAEAEADGSKVICGFTISEGDQVLHYVLTRRRFMKMGVATDLLKPFMHGRQVLYSFRPSTRGLKIPDNFKFDPFVAWRHFV